MHTEVEKLKGSASVHDVGMLLNRSQQKNRGMGRILGNDCLNEAMNKARDEVDLTNAGRAKGRELGPALGSQMGYMEANSHTRRAQSRMCSSGGAWYDTCTCRVPPSIRRC